MLRNLSSHFLFSLDTVLHFSFWPSTLVCCETTIKNSPSFWKVRIWLIINISITSCRIIIIGIKWLHKFIKVLFNLWRQSRCLIMTFAILFSRCQNLIYVLLVVIEVGFYVSWYSWLIFSYGIVKIIVYLLGRAFTAKYFSGSCLNAFWLYLFYSDLFFILKLFYIFSWISSIELSKMSFYEIPLYQWIWMRLSMVTRSLIGIWYRVL